MGKKIISGGEYPTPYRPITNLWEPVFPVMIKLPYPDSNPRALIEKGTSFISTDKYLVTMDDKVGYYTASGDSIVYLDQLNPIKDLWLIGQASRMIGESVIPTMEGGNNFEIIKWVAKRASDTTTVASYSSANEIFLNTNRGTKGITANIYELQSIFRHELIHFIERDKYKSDKNPDGKEFVFKHHADVYFRQMQYEEFKYTSEDFQKDIIVKYVNLLLNQLAQIDQNSTDFKDGIDNFNKIIGKDINATLIISSKRDFYGIPEIILTLGKKKKIYTIVYKYQHDPHK